VVDIDSTGTVALDYNDQGVLIDYVTENGQEDLLSIGTTRHL
jgi:hypothetical protein